VEFLNVILSACAGNPANVKNSGDRKQHNPNNYSIGWIPNASL